MERIFIEGQELEIPVDIVSYVNIYHSNRDDDYYFKYKRRDNKKIIYAFSHRFNNHMDVVKKISGFKFYWYKITDKIKDHFSKHGFTYIFFILAAMFMFFTVRGLNDYKENEQKTNISNCSLYASVNHYAWFYDKNIGCMVNHPEFGWIENSHIFVVEKEK